MSDRNEIQNLVFFRWDQAAGSARGRMGRICGLDRPPQSFEEAEHQEQLAEAERVGRRFYSGSVLRTVFTSFDGSQIQGSKLYLKQAMFDCQGFDFYSPDQILGGFVYLLTLTGEKKIRLAGEQELGLTDGFYREAWATALTETGRELLQKRLEQQISCGRISSSFGPGYYGMGADQLPAFLQALDGKSIGVSLSEGGALLPHKSCAGFYLWLTKSAPPMPDSCSSCKGSRNGCDFCMKNSPASP